MTKGSRTASGVWMKHHLVQASTRRRRLFLFHWRSSTAVLPELDRVFMAVFAFNYLITSYKLLWRELRSLFLVKGGVPEREIQSHRSYCKCSLYTLFTAFSLKKKNPPKIMGARSRNKGFHFLAKFPSHSAEELDHAYVQVPGPYHLYWPK